MPASLHNASRAPSSSWLWCAIAGVISLSGLAPAHAQQEQPPEPGPPAQSDMAVPAREDLAGERWTLRAEPALWYAGTGGDLRLPSASGSGQGQELALDDLGFDSPTLTPTIELNLATSSRWRFTLRGYALSDQSDQAMGFAGRIGGVEFQPQTVLAGSLDMWSVEAEAGYTIWRTQSDGLTGNTPAFVGTLDVLAGARALDVDWNVRRALLPTELPGPDTVLEAGADETYLHPIVGGKFSMQFQGQFTVDLTVNLGGLPLGDAQGYAGDVIAGFTWEPLTNLGVQLGYRAAQFDLSSGDDEEEFSWTGANQGLQLGIVMKF